MCLGIAGGYIPPKYEVHDVVCDYGVFENGELMKGLILNSRANALLIAAVLNADAKHEVHNKSKYEVNKLAKEIHENAVNHGWWEEERSVGDIIALCHSELSEALEAYRNNKPPFYFVECRGFQVSDMNEWRGEKPEGLYTELADCIIRILDFCGKYNVDIEKIIKIKHEYNKNRPYKHGGKKI